MWRSRASHAFWTGWTALVLQDYEHGMTSTADRRW